MVLISCDLFSAADLKLFIESIEQITRLEYFRKQCQQRNRAEYLIKTLRYLDQTHPVFTSRTLTSADRPEEEQQFEKLEEKSLGFCVVKNICQELKRSQSLQVKLEEIQQVKEENEGEHKPTCSKATENNFNDLQSSPEVKQRHKLKLKKGFRAVMQKYYKKCFGSKHNDNDC